MNNEQNDRELVPLSKAKTALANIRTPIDAKKIVDMAELARKYAKQEGLGTEAQNEAVRIANEARFKGGQAIKKMKANGEIKRGQPKKSNVVADDITLDGIGITRDQSSQWQAYASLGSIENLKEIEDEVEENNSEITKAAILRKIKEKERQERIEERQEAPPLPDDKYRVIYADPPWKYGNSGVINESDSYGHVKRHYPDMSISELCDLPIKDMVEDDAVLFLWVTSPLLEECFAVIKAWGFKYKTSFVWDKVGHNFGHYNSVRHEFLLICTRGSCTPDNLKLFDSVQSIEKSQKHSEKPEAFREIIDTLYTYGRKIELFARDTVDGWEVWGNDV